PPARPPLPPRRSSALWPERGEALARFYERWQNEALVLDKWLGVQATSRLPDTLAEVRALMSHPAFDPKNPNKVRALIGSFCHGKIGRAHVCTPVTCKA